MRAQGHPNWVPDRLNDFEGKLVRVTGWLMLDTAHIHHSVLLPGESPRGPLVRVTNWEVHPITKFEVCHSSVKKCKKGQGFQAFD